MPIIASEPEGSKERQLIPAETQRARCVLVADIGTHHEEYMGEDKGLVRKVVIGFELPKYRITPKDAPEVPMMLSKTYTLSLHEKATLRKHLVLWRGVEFTPDQLKAFDIEKVVGAPCLLAIKHVTKRDGKVAAVVESPHKWSRDLVGEPPAQEHESIIYNIGMARGGTFGKLPEWMQEEIAASEEFKVTGKQATGEVGLDPSKPIGESDLPF